MARPLRVLLIEDDLNDADLLAYALKREGLDCELRRVVDAGELRSTLLEAMPDVVVCDFSLPGFDGFQALEITGRICPRVPFFFFSGTIGEEKAKLARRLGAAGYVEKGNPAGLIAQIKFYANM